MSATCDDTAVSMSEDAVVVVGAGISGVSCARALADAGVQVVVLDRARRAGGRMACWTREGRPVDIGAAYFTVRTEAFRDVAETWARRGLARPWVDTFAVADAAGVRGSTTGPVRWATQGGLRSLVEDLAAGLDVRLEHEVQAVGAGPTVDGRPVRAVVMAMPDPQALALLRDDLPGVAAPLESRWQPVVSVVASYPQRAWGPLDAMFVHDSPVSLVVDDGRRRGDAAPVLVVHSTHQTAAEHLDDPDAVIPLALAEIRRLLGVSARPRWVQAKRWGSATPPFLRAQRFHLGPENVAVCGDGWSDRPRIEAAWTSGRDVARELAARLR